MTDSCESCGEAMPITVRMLIHTLMEEAMDLDAPIIIGVENGGVTVSFEIIGVSDVGGEDESIMCLFATSSGAWNTETGASVDAGVLMLDGANDD